VRFRPGLILVLACMLLAGCGADSGPEERHSTQPAGANGGTPSDRTGGAQQQTQEQPNSSRQPSK
jgi:hypothetical protein